MAFAIAGIRLAALASIGKRPPRWRLTAALSWLLALAVAVAIPIVVAWVPHVLDASALIGTVGVVWFGIAGARDGALDPATYRGIADVWHVAIGTTLGVLVSPATVVASGIGVAGVMEVGPIAIAGAATLAVTWGLLRLVADTGLPRDRSVIATAVSVVLVVIALAPLVLRGDDDWRQVRDGLLAAPFTWVLGAPLATAVVFLVALAAVWVFRVWLRLRRPGQHRNAPKLGLFRFAGRQQWHAVAARVATLWLRDRRYHVIAIACVLVPLLIALPLFLAGLPRSTWTLIPTLLLCAMIGWATHNDLAYDGTASWQQLAARVPGWQDRLGRMVPSLIVGVPVTVLVSRLGVTLWGDEAIWWPLLGAAFALLGSGLGVSAIVGARWPYPVGGPDESPFLAPASQSSSAALTQALALFGTFALASPLVAVLFIHADHPVQWLGGVGTAVGVVCAAAGVVFGGAILDKRAPVILSAAMRD